MKFYGLRNKETKDLLNVEPEVDVDVYDYASRIETTLGYNFVVDVDNTLPWLVSEKAVVLDVYNNRYSMKVNDLNYPYSGSCLDLDDYEIAELDI